MIDSWNSFCGSVLIKKNNNKRESTVRVLSTRCSPPEFNITENRYNYFYFVANDRSSEISTFVIFSISNKHYAIIAEICAGNS